MAKLKDGYYKQTAEAIGSNLHVLLAGGGSKALSDFATSTGVVTALGTSGNYVTWTKNGTVNNLVVPYAAVAEGISGIYSAGLPTSFSTGRVTYHYNILVGTEGLFPNADNANSILTVNRHAGNYLSQLGFSSDKRLYFRSASAADINSIAWNKIAYTSEIPTKTSQLTNDSGYVIGGPYLPLAGGTLTGKLTTGHRIVLKGSILELCESSGSGGIMLWNGVSSGDGVRNLMIYDGASWNRAIHSGNYNSYAPKLDGTGASGTWGINISGNADTVDNLHASDLIEYGTLVNPYNANSTGWYKFLTLVAGSNDGTVDFIISSGETNNLGVADYYHFETRPANSIRQFVYTHLGKGTNYIRNNVYAYTSDNKTYTFYIKYPNIGNWECFCKIRHISSRGATLTYSNTWQTATPSGTAYAAEFAGYVKDSMYTANIGDSTSSYTKASLDTALNDKYSSTVTRTKNTVLAAPNGSNGAATFRALVADDLPSHGIHVPGIKSANAVTTLGWGTNNNYVPDLSLLAYWNGAYTDTSSNLTYAKGGKIITSGNIGSQSVNYATTAGSAGSATNADTVDNLHASDFLRAYGTLGTGNSYDSDWGQSVVTFDPVANGTYPERNPNVTILNLGNNYARRKQLAFNYNNNNIYFRRKVDNAWTPWVRLALASEIPTSLKNPNSISFKNAAGTTVSYDGSSALDLTGGIYYAVNASKASTLDCFARKATANCTWGTLTASNGYTPIYWGDSASGGGIGFSDKGGQTFMQIDGDYYAQEGAYKVWHAGNLRKVSQLSNDAGYLTSLPSHVHTYIESKPNYSFTSSTLPNSFDWGISAGFVADNAGYGSYGSVLTVRTYTGGGGTLQLYAPYSKTYGGTRLKARFGDYDKSNGNSWTDLKEIAWTSDIPSVGNGTVTINQAGASKGSFTLNQSTAATINLTDTNYYPTAFSWTGGTAAGPTGSLTGVGMSAVSFGAIPAASGTASGIVTTGNQSFSGQKTFNTFVLANYITPISDTTGCGIGTSAWRYYEGYFKNLYTNYIYMYPRTYSGTLYLTGFKNTPSSTSILDSQLYASSYVKIQNSASSSAAVYAPGGFYESSDERLKNLLKPVRVDLDELSKLRKVYYTWKNSSDLGTHLGVIAQDVQRLYPELVTIDSETGYLSLSYDKLSVIALEAIDTLYKSYKELKRRVDTLEKLITNKGIL